MNIVIIEDERLVADDLEENLARLLRVEKITISKLYTVKEAVSWFEENPLPELIFSDIQLGDGLSFEIFNRLELPVPIIFCTAYDQYAIEAFNLNGINYLLKPYTSETLEAALAKYRRFKTLFSHPQITAFSDLRQMLAAREPASKTGSILVYQKDKIMPVKVSDIALFYLQNEVVYLLCFDGKIHLPNKTLDELEKLTGSDFFRATRQILISHNAIKDASSYFSRRLSLNLTVPFAEKITVSRARTPAFLEWLTR